MTQQHTPGPWFAERFQRPYNGGNVNLIGFRVTATGDDGRTIEISEAYPKPTPVAVNEANARLIAAAPDLLAALEKIERVCGGASNGTIEHEVALCARAAIAKATGQ